MKKFNPSKVSPFLIREKQCKFDHSCNYYSNSSYTCTHMGGEYCGKYRILETSNIYKVKNQNIEENIILS